MPGRPPGKAKLILVLEATTNGPDVTASARLPSGLEETKFARRQQTPATSIFTHERPSAQPMPPTTLVHGSWSFGLIP